MSIPLKLIKGSAPVTCRKQPINIELILDRPLHTKTGSAPLTRLFSQPTEPLEMQLFISDSKIESNFICNKLKHEGTDYTPKKLKVIDIKSVEMDFWINKRTTASVAKVIDKDEQVATVCFTKPTHFHTANIFEISDDATSAQSGLKGVRAYFQDGRAFFNIVENTCFLSRLVDAVFMEKEHTSLFHPNVYFASLPERSFKYLFKPAYEHA
ncbi:MAG: hypothetical protein EOM37_04740 [Proteobacteria bacterium]|jgi:hypothetical protein|nr:hypothetical protein [Alphaproteobacteria bacterium]NCC03339.1 hypothetical protein [Pseudomonadota bacterium]